jgi:hypothetical protein
MQITRNSLQTATGPSDWFTSTVCIDTVATASEPSHLQAASVHSFRHDTNKMSADATAPAPTFG